MSLLVIVIYMGRKEADMVEARYMIPRETVRVVKYGLASYDGSSQIGSMGDGYHASESEWKIGFQTSEGIIRYIPTQGMRTDETENQAHQMMRDFAHDLPDELDVVWEREQRIDGSYTWTRSERTRTPR